MAVSLADINALPDYTPTHMLKLLLKAKADILMYGSTQMGSGRSLTRADLASIDESIRYVREEIDADDGGGVALVNFGEPQ